MAPKDAAATLLDRFVQADVTYVRGLHAAADGLAEELLALGRAAGGGREAELRRLSMACRAGSALRGLLERLTQLRSEVRQAQSGAEAAPDARAKKGAST